MFGIPSFLIQRENFIPDSIDVTSTPPTEVLLVDSIEDTFAFHANSTRVPRTLDQYRRAVERFQKCLGEADSLFDYNRHGAFQRARGLYAEAFSLIGFVSTYSRIRIGNHLGLANYTPDEHFSNLRWCLHVIHRLAHCCYCLNRVEEGLFCCQHGLDLVRTNPNLRDLESFCDLKGTLARIYILQGRFGLAEDLDLSSPARTAYSDSVLSFLAVRQIEKDRVFPDGPADLKRRALGSRERLYWYCGDEVLRARISSAMESFLKEEEAERISFCCGFAEFGLRICSRTGDAIVVPSLCFVSNRKVV